MIFVEANITRASGGVGPLPHKSGSPQGVHVRDVPDRPSHPVNGDGSPERNFDDRGEKFARYQRCSGLEVYILVSQHERHVEVYRKANGWQPENFSADQLIQLDQLDLELPLDEIYAGVL
jgi:Putative restriction endonuclease